MIFESVPIWVSTVNVTVTFEHGVSGFDNFILKKLSYS